MKKDSKPWPPKNRRKIYCRRKERYRDPIIDEDVFEWHIPPLDKEEDQDDFIAENTFMGLMFQLFDIWSYRIEEVTLVNEIVNDVETEVFEGDNGWQFLLPKPLAQWEREFFEHIKPEMAAKKLAEEIGEML